jgi:HAE1 family hydrophobic/amphiphilic exporter-1
MEWSSMRSDRRSGARAALVVLSLFAASVPAFGQDPARPTGPIAPTPQAGGPTGRAKVAGARAISVDEAVRLALEQNLSVQVERLNPELQQLAITQARTAWTPTFSAGLTARTQDSPPSSFLSGADDKVESNAFGPTFSFGQLLPIGTSYQVSFDSTRSTSNNQFSSFNPSVTGNLDFSIVQPLWRDFKINAQQYQLEVARKNLEISDVSLQQQVAATIRNVKNSYWEYKYALASLEVARQSLDLAQESLRNTRSRVEIGTLAPIDVVEAESEVAAREEAVILAEASIGRAEDALRALIFDPGKVDVWNTPLDPVDPVPFQVQGVDVDGAVRKALRDRTDLQQTRKALERTVLGEKFYTNQTKPAVDLRLDYNSTGLAGTQLVRGAGAFPPPVIGEVKRSYGDLLGDIFTSTFPTWAFSVNFSYPIGTSTAEASLARTQLEEKQQDINQRSLEFSIVSQVRDAARTLVSNSKRVDATRAARVLAERRLDAEEKKFAAGMSTSFQVFQAQRDLSTARNNELRAVLDYTQSQVDYETVQVAPVSGASSFTGSSAVGNAIGSSTGVGAAAAGGGQ